MRNRTGHNVRIQLWCPIAWGKKKKNHMLTLVTLVVTLSGIFHSNVTGFLSICWQLRHGETLRRKTERAYVILRLRQPWPQRTTINIMTKSMWPNRTKTPQDHYNGLRRLFSSHSFFLSPHAEEILLNDMVVHFLTVMGAILISILVGGRNEIKIALHLRQTRPDGNRYCMLYLKAPWLMMEEWKESLI